MFPIIIIIFVSFYNLCNGSVSDNYYILRTEIDLEEIQKSFQDIGKDIDFRINVLLNSNEKQAFSKETVSIFHPKYTAEFFYIGSSLAILRVLTQSDNLKRANY